MYDRKPKLVINVLPLYGLYRQAHTVRVKEARRVPLSVSAIDSCQ